MIICGGRTYKQGDDGYGCGKMLDEQEEGYIKEFNVKEHDSLCTFCFSQKFVDQIQKEDLDVSINL